jgi:lysozyme
VHQRRAAVRPSHAVSRSVTNTLEPLESRLLMARTPGIDVSHWQGTINWTSVFNAGKKFAFQKSTEADNYVDPTMATNMANGKAAGLLMGAYHFPDPTSVTDTNADGLADDAVAEANWFYAQAGQYMIPGYLKPVLDMEAGSGLGKTNLSKWTNDFCTRIQQLTGVDPIIYANNNYAANFLNSTVTTHKLWLASITYTDAQALGTTSPPASTSGAWNTAGKTWDFWQYSWTGSVSGISGNVDMDVYTGDLTSLQNNFLIGSPPATPATPSPTNGATNVNRNGLVLNWADSAFATAYDVYLDNVLSASDLLVSQWTVSPTTTTGAHTWKVVAKNASFSTTGPTWGFNVAALPAPAAPSTPNHNGDVVNARPVTLDWADSTNATSYDVYLGTNVNPSANVTTSQYTLNPAEGVRLWRVVAKNADGFTNGPQWSYTLDLTPPTAAIGSQTPTTGASTFDFTVTYTDALSGVSGASLGNGDVTVTGPNAFNQIADFVSVDTPGDGLTRVVTYRINAPGGSWDPSDNGSYSVSQNATQVSDIGGNFRAAASIGNFSASAVFAYVSNGTLHIEYLGTNQAKITNNGGGNYVVTENSNTLSFAAGTFSNIVVHGTGNDDAVTLEGAIAKPLTLDGQTGSDSITLAAGASYTFAADIAAQSANVAITVATGASATFSATQHLSSLNVNGSAAITGTGKVLVMRELDVIGSLDLGTNSLIVDYTGDDPLGDWVSGAYTGVTGMLQRGFNNGAWNANGIVTSAYEGLRKGLSVGETSDVMSLSNGQTASFAGETVDSTSVLIRFTLIGDGNLDGAVNADDYALIDLYSTTSGSNGYFRGDYNLDGSINADDYALIDINSL